MDFSKIDFSKLAEIKDKLNLSPQSQINALSSLGQDILSLSKTKVYLVNEFECQEQKMIVVIVRWYDYFKQKYQDFTCVWDKGVALK